MSKKIPLLGDEDHFVSTCTRTVEGGMCGAPATQHIVWPLLFSSNACDDHKPRGYDVLEVHAFGPECHRPDALWQQKENTCRVPRGASDYITGRVLA